MLSLTCVTGCPGSGKSFMSGKLKDLGFDIIHIDDFAKSLVGLDFSTFRRRYQWIVDVNQIVTEVHSTKALKHDDLCHIAIEGTCSNFHDLYNALVEEFKYVCVFFILESPIVLREVYKERVQRMSESDHFYDGYVRLTKLGNKQLEDWTIRRILEVTDKGINVRFIDRNGYYTILWLILLIEIRISNNISPNVRTLSLINDFGYCKLANLSEYPLLKPNAHISKCDLDDNIDTHLEDQVEFSLYRKLIGEVFKFICRDRLPGYEYDLVPTLMISNKTVLSDSLDFLLKAREEGIID